MPSTDYLSQLPILPDEKIILPKKVQENLVQAVEKIIEQTDTKEYRQWMQNFFSSKNSPLPEEIKKITKNFVQDIASPFNKNFASFDFHLSGENNEDPKPIEYSFFPVGDSFIRGVIPSDFSEQYQENFLEILKGKKKIALVDTKISKQKRMAEFLWTQEFLEDEGIEVVLADAESITVGAHPCGRPNENQKQTHRSAPTEQKIFVTDYKTGKKISVDSILNRCTFFDYLNNPESFSGLVEVEESFPEKISTTYREWLFSEKISSVYFTEKNLLPDIFPKTIFSSPDCTGEKIFQTCGKNFIAKPLFSYASNGIFINPSPQKTSEILEKKLPYLFQQTIPAPTVADGRKFEVRVFVINGKISVFFARVYHGDLSNYDQPKSGICAVEFE